MAQVRPGVVPASVPPSPGRPTMKGQGVPGGVCPAALVLHPAGPAGRPSAGRRSKTWPGEFAQAGKSRGPGTDRPGSSSRALIPRPRVTPEGDTYAARPEVRVRWGFRCRVVCPLGARAVHGPRARRPCFRVPWVRPKPASVTGPCTWCPTRSGCSEPYVTIVDSPLPRPSSDWAPALTSPGLQASGPSRCDLGPAGLFRDGPVAAVMRACEWVF